MLEDSIDFYSREIGQEQTEECIRLAKAEVKIRERWDLIHSRKHLLRQSLIYYLILSYRAKLYRES